MAEVQTMRGTKIYECDFNITGVTDYGVTLDALLNGKEKVPVQGARVDVAFEGDIKGRITGKVRSGVEYLQLRADGRIDLDGRATVETEDGHRMVGVGCRMTVLGPRLGTLAGTRETMTMCADKAHVVLP